jgi:hypothetical protein
MGGHVAHGVTQLAKVGQEEFPTNEGESERTFVAESDGDAHGLKGGKISPNEDANDNVEITAHLKERF